MPTFSTNAPIEASIKVPNGGIEITASDRGDVVVTVTPTHPSREQDVRAANETTVEFVDGRLTVAAPRPRIAVFGPTESVEVRVELPTGSRVVADASVGSVQASGVLGATRVKTGVGSVSLGETAELWVHAAHGTITASAVRGSLDATCDHGNIRIGSIAGDSTLRSSHGSISVDETTGDVEAKLSYGNLDIRSAHASVAAKTAHGSIEVAAAEAGTINLETGFGSLTIGVREGVPAWLDISSKNGRVRNDLTAQAAPAAAERSVAVHARANFGNITVRRAA